MSTNETHYDKKTLYHVGVFTTQKAFAPETHSMKGAKT